MRKGVKGRGRRGTVGSLLYMGCFYLNFEGRVERN